MPSDTSNDAPRPNILWISLEDTSPRFGCTGDPIARTPNIDALAAAGCRYANAFSTAGVCAPSRAAIITGMYQTAIGAHHMRTTHRNEHVPEMATPYEAVPPPYVKCFPEYLRAAGYFCTNNEKTDYQFAPPRTAWDQCGKHGHWRNRPDPSQPFFAVFNPTLTHESGMWPKDGEQIVTDPNAVTLPPYLPDTPKTRLALARHYDNLARADERVGQLLAELEEDGLAEDTLVVLWSDHGEGLPRGKRWPNDAGTHVPLIVRWPGRVNAGIVRSEIVSLIDLAPTMLHLAGVPAPRHLQGRAFLDADGQPPADIPFREYAFACKDRMDEAYDRVRSVRDDRFRYVRNFHPELPYESWIPYRNRHPVMQELWRLKAEGALEGPQSLLMQDRRPPEELYDIRADPWETNNLADAPAYRETLRRMRAALDDWTARYDVYGDVPEAEMAARFWPGGQQPVTAPPLFVPLGGSAEGTEPVTSEATFAGPLLVQMFCATQGASIAYTMEPGEDAHWRLYTGPIRLAPGETVTLRARACRLGYRESDERMVTITAAG